MTNNKNKQTRSEEVRFNSRDKSFVLQGTLQRPASSNSSTATAALIIAGSGPIDRDGNVRGGLLMRMNLNTQNLLSDFLVTSCGVGAVLTYDKRGVAASRSPTRKNLYYEAGVWDLVEDAKEAYRYLVNEGTAKDVVLVGHSEGAILLPLIAQEIQKDASLPPPKGLVFLSGFGETVEEASANQRETILGEVASEPGLQGWILRKVLTRKKLEQQYADYIKKVQDKDRDFVSMQCGLIKVPTKWWREHMEWDAKATLLECTSPCLAITGGKDAQVRASLCDPSMAKTLAPKAASLETHIIPNMTHVLRSIEGPSKLIEAQKQYTKLGKQPLDLDLLQILQTWFQ